MPWWLTSILFPLSPAVIAALVGLAYVSLRRSIVQAIGQGQLFFVAVGLAGQSLAALMAGDRKHVAENALTLAILWSILILSVALYAVAAIWRYQEPPKQGWANLLTIAGSLGLLLLAISIAFSVLSGSPPR